MIKRIILGILIIFLLVTTIGCEKNQDSNADLSEKVIDLEKNENKLENLDITYEDYKENVSDIVNSEFLESKSSDVLFAIEDKSYTNADLNDLSKEETEELKNEVREIEEEKGLNITDKKIQVSKNYDTDMEDIKYVFSKITEKDESDTEIISTKRYTFTKTDGNWKVENIEFDTVSIPDNIDQDKDKLVSNLKYQSKNNEEVEYIEEIDLLSD